MFVITAMHSVYRSVDGGKDWENEAEKIGSGVKIDMMYMAQSDEQMIVLKSEDNHVFVSKNLGASYERLAEKFLSVAVHPHASNKMLGLSLLKECYEDANQKDSEEPSPAAPTASCHSVLHYSDDFGKTWKPILTYVHDYFWQPSEKAVDTSASQFNSIYAMVHQDKVGDQDSTAKLDLIVSEDYFTSSRKIVDDVAGVYLSQRFIYIVANKPHVFVDDTAKTDGSESHTVPGTNPSHIFYVSHSNLTSTKLFTVHMPHIDEHDFTLLESAEGSALVFLHHSQLLTGSIFISDASGVFFSRSLDNIPSVNGHPELKRVNCLEGVYIANTILFAKTDSNLDNLNGDHIRSADEQDKLINAESHALKSSLISFDKGADWAFLAPPIKNYLGSPYECENPAFCQLNLIVSTIYSTPAAGLVLGCGNVGRYLREDEESVHTYLSRDAGKSWFEIIKGRHIYEIGNHGGIIVMANSHAPVNSIMYSLDQGLSFESYAISLRNVHLDSLSLEPSRSGFEFLIIGHDKSSGFIQSIDFQSLHPAQCAGADVAGTDASDFELWSPTTNKENKCFLGRTLTLTRRKRNRKCYIPFEYSPIFSSESCTCTLADMECDFGYKRAAKFENAETIEAEVCVRDHSIAIEEEPCEIHMYQSHGYQKIAGNRCIGGDQWLPVVHECPHNQSVESNTFWVFMSAVIIVSVLALLIYFVPEVRKRCCALTNRLEHSIGSAAENGEKKSSFSDRNYNPVKKEEFVFDDDFDDDNGPESFDEEAATIAQKLKSKIVR